jgi:hypothetical protein
MNPKAIDNKAWRKILHAVRRKDPNETYDFEW